MFSPLPKVIAVSDLRQDAARVLADARKSNRVTLVTQRGRAAAVILGIDAYERAEREREVLRLLARGEKEIAANEGYDLDSVLAEADALLDATK
jgi:prevent-host-death family protein